MRKRKEPFFLDCGTKAIRRHAYYLVSIALIAFSSTTLPQRVRLLDFFDLRQTARHRTFGMNFRFGRGTAKWV